MKRTLMIAAALASLALATAPSPTQAATSVGFSVRIGDPYRGAAIRFRSEPDYVVIPGTQVSYIDDYYDRDFYRYGGWYYMVDNGYWYRARSYRGPFIRIDYRSVPGQFTYVPTRYRRHWGSTNTYFRYRGSDNDRYYQSRDYRYRDRYNRDRDYGDRYRDRDRNWNDRDRSQRTRDRNWDWNRNRDRRDNGDDRSGRDGRYRDRGDNRDDGNNQNDDDQNNDGRRDRWND